jgi:hypothetical protein
MGTDPWLDTDGFDPFLNVLARVNVENINNLERVRRLNMSNRYLMTILHLDFAFRDESRRPECGVRHQPRETRKGLDIKR